MESGYQCCCGLNFSDSLRAPGLANPTPGFLQVCCAAARPACLRSCFAATAASLACHALDPVSADAAGVGCGADSRAGGGGTAGAGTGVGTGSPGGTGTGTGTGFGTGFGTGIGTGTGTGTGAGAGAVDTYMLLYGRQVGTSPADWLKAHQRTSSVRYAMPASSPWSRTLAFATTAMETPQVGSHSALSSAMLPRTMIGPGPGTGTGTGTGVGVVSGIGSSESTDGMDGTYARENAAYATAFLTLMVHTAVLDGRP